MDPITAVIEAVVLLLMFPLLRGFWRLILQSDCDTPGSGTSWIWVIVGTLSLPMTFATCMIFIGGHPLPPELWIPYGVAIYFSLFAYVLAILRAAGVGHLSVGRLMGFAPSSSHR